MQDVVLQKRGEGAVRIRFVLTVVIIFQFALQYCQTCARRGARQCTFEWSKGAFSLQFLWPLTCDVEPKGALESTSTQEAILGAANQLVAIVFGLEGQVHRRLSDQR